MDNLWRLSKTLLISNRCKVYKTAWGQTEVTQWQHNSINIECYNLDGILVAQKNLYAAKTTLTHKHAKPAQLVQIN